MFTTVSMSFMYVPFSSGSIFYRRRRRRLRRRNRRRRHLDPARPGSLAIRGDQLVRGSNPGRVAFMLNHPLSHSAPLPITSPRHVAARTDTVHSESHALAPACMHDSCRQRDQSLVKAAMLAVLLRFERIVDCIISRSARWHIRHLQHTNLRHATCRWARQWRPDRTTTHDSRDAKSFSLLPRAQSRTKQVSVFKNLQTHMPMFLKTKTMHMHATRQPVPTAALCLYIFFSFFHT